MKNVKWSLFWEETRFVRLVVVRKVRSLTLVVDFVLRKRTGSLKRRFFLLNKGEMGFDVTWSVEEYLESVGLGFG